MRQSARILRRAALCAAAFLASGAAASDDNFEKGKQAYAQKLYVTARDALNRADRDKLTDAEKKELDRMLGELPAAITGSARGQRDFTQAEEAFAQGRWGEADAAYGRVETNAYAATYQIERATARRKQIAEKQTLADAARPEGPVKPAPAPPPAPGQTIQVGPAQAPNAQPTPVAQGDVFAAGAAPAAPPERLSIIDRMRQNDALLWQRAVAKMEEAIARANEEIAANRWDEARRLAEGAVHVIEANRSYAQPPSLYEDARQIARDLQQRVQDEFDRWSMLEASREQDEVAARIAARREALERERQEKIEQLFNTAERQRKEQRFAEAAATIREITYLDPGNAKAAHYLEIYDDLASFQSQKQLTAERGRQTQGLFEELDEVVIPWHQDILYPRNWLEISARRDARGLGAADEDSELNRQLEDVIAEVDFTEQPLEQVVEFISDLKSINMSVDWDNLSQNGIDRDKPVSLKLQDISLRTALTEILTQAGGDVRLGYLVGDGVLRVATREKLDRDKFINVYDIRDLLVKIPRFTNAPLIEGGDTAFASAASGETNSFFGTSSGGLDNDAERADDLSSAEEVMDIIRQTVAPDSWRETGGGDGALRELNGQLIVYNTADAQSSVASLLDQLRQSRALMISVESRFLIVTSNFLEEIGVDLDFVFNAGEAGFDPAFNNQGAALFDPFTQAAVLIPRTLSQIGAAPATPAFGVPFTPTGVAQPFVQPGFVPGPGGVIPSINQTTPLPAQQGSINITDPQGINTGIPGSLARAASDNPGLSIAGSYLDNLQVDFLIRATQANRRSSIVQAPRLMLFNGQRAWVAVVRNRQYVSSVTANVAEGAVGVQPIQGVAQSGTALDIDGTIASNRKYVTLTVRTGLANEPIFDRFEVQRASGNSPGIFIQLTDQETRGIRTTVSVPDGGTVLLGGMKQVGEIEIEAGVPLLSKIPILKRAFTNTTTVKDTQTLLILLKAKILIQDEAEDEAFPTLSSALN